MMDLACLSAFVLFVLTSLCIAARTHDGLILVAKAILFMANPLYGAAFIGIGAFETTLGSVLFALLMIAHSFRVVNIGAVAGPQAVQHCLLITALGIALAMIVHQVAPWRETAWAVRPIGAQCVVFCLCANLMVFAIGWMRRHCGPLAIPLAVAWCLVVATMLYYPIAYWGVLRPERMATLTLNSIIVKLAIVFVSAPFLWAVMARHDQAKRKETQ